ncbi:MAG: hypothetical protein ACOC2U_02470 [bacterium]
MIYTPPKYEGKSQFVPIVVKNKDWLVGYINGMNVIKSIVIESLYDNGIDINMRGIDFCLDSSRFNDILQNGKRESECTDIEIREYFKSIIDNKIDSMEGDEHPDNQQIFNDCFFETECICGLGIYSFDNPEDIPMDSLKCQICGRTVIDYTNIDDDNFEYDGNLNFRSEKIINKLNDEYRRDLNDEDEDEDED